MNKERCCISFIYHTKFVFWFAGIYDIFGHYGGRQRPKPPRNSDNDFRFSDKRNPSKKEIERKNESAMNFPR